VSPRYAYEPYRPPCEVEGCNRTSAVRRLCRAHYIQLWREEHPDYQRRWREAHPERVAEYRENYDRRHRRRRYAET